MIVNATFRIDRSFKDGGEGNDYPWGEHLWGMAYAASQDYREIVVTDNPAKEEEWYMNRILDFDKYISELYPGRVTYPGRVKMYQSQEPAWRYLEKFDTFWFREWVSFCSVTEALVSELKHFQVTGQLPSVYRGVTQSVVLRHLETLHNYWD